MYVFYGGVVITRLCLFFKDDNNHEEEAAPPTHPLLEAAGDPHPHQRRRRGSRGPDYVCPFLGCVERTRKMRDHVTLVHLYSVFRRSVPPKVGAGLRYRILVWSATTYWEKALRWRTWPKMFPQGRSSEIFELAGL